MASKPATISGYIKTFPIAVRPRLTEMHNCIQAAAPGAKEALKWGMPSYSYEKILVMFGGFKNHTGFFPGTSAMEAFAKELEKYKSSKATVQFPHDQQLPKSLIKKMVKFRIKEHEAGTIAWK